MKITELKEKYDRLLNDEDFDMLDLGLKNPNIFQILRISKNEIRHSNFLSWLLDPNESHKLGDIFLKRFLREVFSSDKFDDIDQVDVEGLNLNKVEIQREWKNIDVLIKLEDVIVCIENKVLSSEHSNQLSRYKKIIESEFPNHKQTFVYLNPDGESSIEESENYYPISYEFVVDTLMRIISVYGESLNNQVKNYIKDYITIIKRELMSTDKLTMLSQKIYNNHKELFDFIIERKPEIVDELKIILNKVIKEKGWILGSENKHYVRFYTTSIKELIYINKNKNGLKNRESFLFELELNTKRNVIIWKSLVTPSDESYNSGRISEILQEISGFKIPVGKKWLVNKSKVEKFPFDGLNELTEEEVNDKLRSILDKFEPLVLKVEEKLLEHSDELLRMKNG
jgi:PD-(D/E)XK nuclease superfamily